MKKSKSSTKQKYSPSPAVTPLLASASTTITPKVWSYPRETRERKRSISSKQPSQETNQSFVIFQIPAVGDSYVAGAPIGARRDP
ncbi:unnamed protein product [Linum trigynum]|uniref:Uncharacterized protein n=1 Tax=Linum trigynum TaxID=586398 RepID=A0AAV2EAX9_9ROSI